ncbi:MAG: NAD(P)-binding domain-containing protein [Nitrososphaerota archaeon]|nr:NAD(P)-binding domain-containing protein [Nitrososphaerota archaeon]MDG7025378.1 NAD(P)-binding domain-containing protein [Nitrososphaerota archaeon]
MSAPVDSERGGRAIRIGIIGFGEVGGALKAGIEKLAGYEVKAAPHDRKLVRDVVAWGEVIILAVPLSAVGEVVKEMGESAKGKILVDVTNDFGDEPPVKSRAEELQANAPDTKVVKAFNTVFARHMRTGKVGGEAISLFVTGDDPDAKRRVMNLGRAIGFLPVDAGPLKNSRWIESLGVLNGKLGYGTSNYGADIGFRVIGASA